MDPISALGLAASIMAVIQLTQEVLKKLPVGASKHDKDELRRLLSLASGFRGAYESLEYDLENSEKDDSRAMLLRQLEQPANECKAVLKCLHERLKSVDFFRQHIVGRHFDMKFNTCIERLRDEKELFELVMQVDQHSMLREIKNFSQKTEDIMLLLETSTEDTSNRLETLTDLTREHYAQSRAHYKTTETKLGEVHAAVLSQKIQAEEEVKDVNRNAIVRWLSNTDPSLNHDAAKSNHESTTGDWFIKGETYSEWLTNPRSFLWLHGIPGCGKSVLCSTIIEETKSYCSSNITKETQLAYYYFSFADSQKQIPANFLRSIIAQLAGSRISNQVQNLYSSYRTSAPPLDALKLALKSELKTPVESFILIDALDECPSNHGAREELCRLLVEISSWSLPGLHMLATSRKKSDINEIISTIQGLKQVPIQNVEVNADIRLYVRSQLAKDPKLGRWVSKVEGLERILVDKAKGMFRWVFCQMDVLKKCLSAKDVKRALDALPKTLEETYQRILEGIDEQYHQRAAIALQWLVFSARPLTIRELAEASVLNPDDETPFDIDERFENPEDILEILSSLVTTDQEDSDIMTNGSHTSDYDDIVVRLAHFSVQEYLVSNRIQASLGAIFRIEESSAHQFIAKSCFAYIDYYISTADESLSHERVEPYPLLDYSQACWTHHVRVCKDTESVLARFVCEHLTPSWLYTWEGLRLFHHYWINYERTVSAPLYYAAEVGLPSVAKELINSGADVNLQGGTYGNALQAACYSKNDATVSLLLANEAVVSLLLANGADVNAQGGLFANAIQAASDSGNEAVVSLLLAHGADVNAQGDGYYGSALQAASSWGHEAVVSLLLANGADVNLQGGFYGSALQAVSAWGNEAIVSLLLAHGADVNAQGGQYGNALQEACHSRNEAVVSLLLANGADVNAQGGYYGSALQAACYSRDEAVVSLLLANGADVNAQGGYYGSALQAACHSRDEAVVSLMLVNGPDINAQGGRAALETTLTKVELTLVKTLLEHGADFDAQGDEEIIQALGVKDYEVLARLLIKRAENSGKVDP